MSITEYFDFWKTYTNEYGSKTAVLYQKGKFYELYSVDKLNLGNAREISNILNMKLTKSNKNIEEISITNPNFMGFQTSGLERCVNVLIQHGYTVVQIDQELPDKNNIIKRSVKKIYTSATNMDEQEIGKYLVVLYYNDDSIGISCIQCISGEIYTYQIDTEYLYDETIRFLQAFPPTELFYCLNGSNDIINEIKTLYKGSDITYDTNYDTISYQDSILEMIYPDHGTLSGIEFVNLERYKYASASLVILLNRIYNLDKELLKNINIPIYWTEHKKLILDATAISQLDLYSFDGKNSVHELLNTCNRIGKNTFRKILLNPISDISILKKRYSIIQALIDYKKNKISEPNKSENVSNNNINNINDSKIKPKIIKKTQTNMDLNERLGSLSNLERLHRLIEIRKIKITEIKKILDCYKIYKEIETILKQCNIVFDYPNCTDYFNLLKCFNNLSIDFSDYENETEIFCLFNKGIYHDLDVMFNLYDDYYQKLIVYIKLMNLTNTKPYVTLDENFKIICNLSYYKKNLEKIKLPSALLYSKQTESRCQVYNDEIKELGEKLIDMRNEILTKTKVYYNDILDKIISFKGTYDNICKILAETDVYNTMAENAIKWNYVQPTISSDHQNSYIKVKGLRHPLIERSKNLKTFYISHDIELSNNGIILYGINSSGKSSIMKSIGLSIILAQCGFYVPCTEFIFYPYTRLMTRIIGSDDIHRGMSSFEIEMSELRSILLRADNRSMVLGDEISKGSEIYSSISIVASSIIHLANLKVAFLFASHLHQLAELEEITSLNNIKQMHLTIRFDREQIIYDRLLKDGPGPTKYGIEVAKAMKLPDNVIKMANIIRMKYYDEQDGVRLYELKRSKYNNNVLLGKCIIQNCQEIAVDTHHIKYQSDADCNGLIDNMDMNAKCNLAPLCKYHHNMVHVGEDGKYLVINGFLKTGKVDCYIKEII